MHHSTSNVVDRFGLWQVSPFSIEMEKFMAIGVTAKLTVQDGKNAEFEKAFASLSESVNSLEPGCRFYALHQSRTNPQLYIVLEQYDNEAALAAHGKTDHYLAAGKVLATCLAAAPEIELMDSVAQR